MAEQLTIDQERELRDAVFKLVESWMKRGLPVPKNYKDVYETGKKIEQCKRDERVNGRRPQFSKN